MDVEERCLAQVGEHCQGERPHRQEKLEMVFHTLMMPIEEEDINAAIAMLPNSAPHITAFPEQPVSDLKPASSINPAISHSFVHSVPGPHHPV